MSSNLSDLGFGGGATSAVVNAFSSGGVSEASLQAQGSNGAKEVLSGALTANTLATLLSVTGAGEVPFLTAYTKDATPRTVRLKVVVDGQAPAVFDATTDVISSSGRGLAAAGSASGPVGSPVVFNSSLEVSVASSITETNKLAIGYILNKKGG
ncbi:hypothetical protein LNV47_18085 [Paucibacter sp. DJ4R-1]|nr:hypothetical protein [Paucibacter sp. DJ4R-1]